MRPKSIIATLVLLGCGSETTEIGRLVPIQADTAVAIQLHDAVGYGTVAVPIRQTNSYGIAIPGGGVSIAVRDGGTIAGSELTFDATGYATAFVDVPAGRVAEVQVQAATGTDKIGRAAKAYGLSNSLPEMPLALTQAVDPEVNDYDFIAPGTGGVAVSSADRVWWVPMGAGQPSHSVANLPFLIDGMWGAHVDRDGVLDLAIWADSQLLILRGRSNGGYGWGGAWSAGDREIAGVTATDVNGDRIADLVVGISTDEESTVEVMLGDGQWSFQPTDPLQLSYPIEGISASDDDRNGDPDITELTGASGVLRRYTVTDEGWVAGTPPEIAQYKAEPGSLLLPPIDLNDEGAPEIAVIGPSEAEAQEMVFYVLGEPPIKYPLSFGPFDSTFADLDGDGAQDLVALEDDVVNAIRFDADEDRFISQATVGMGDSGPIAARDFTDDGRADLAILRDGVTLRIGTEPDSGGWSVESYSFRSYNLGLSGPVTTGDFVGNGKLDVVGVTDNEGVPTITGWWFIQEEDGPSLQRAASIPTQPGLLLDFAHCGNNVYALIMGADGAAIHRIRINTTEGNFDLEDKWPTPISADADFLACGSATGSTFGVAASNDSGDWTIYSNDKSEVASGNIGPTAGIVMADTDGDGIDDIHNCDVFECKMAAADFNGDGRDEIVTSSLTTSVTSADGATQTLPRGGHIDVDDINEDGWPDLILYDETSGTLSIHQGMVNGIAPAVSIQTERNTTGAGVLRDVDQDGILEFVTSDSDGKLIHTRTDG